MSAVGIEPLALPMQRPAYAALRTLMICDLVDSTGLTLQLGDWGAAELMRRHDRIARDLLRQHDGREIDKTDGFLLLFERPVQAVSFALDYQRLLQELGRTESCPLRARIGIAVGEIVLWENDASDIHQGAKPVEAEGLVKPIAARLMSLARPGQILMSGIAYDLTRRAQNDLADRPTLRWQAHGNYRFKNLPEAVHVYEVGEKDIAPFRAPSWSGKAHREIPWWRRPGTLAVEVALAAIALLVPAYFFLRSPPAIAFANRDWVVVGDLKNLTDDTNFNESLQSAFRIGLEQSRHVNVLSDLKTRETLKMMQRDPDKTAIDRAVGSEIAIRDGVRALILPTIAEIGGRVRVTAEVVDPNTQTTVYSESADGVGENSVLPSLDKVNGQLRVRLGEALATVTHESQPLEKVATKNLDALKAYTLGARAYDLGDMKSAIAFYSQAVKNDPDFARAHLALAASYGNIDQYADASKEVDAALARRDRLSSRDALYAEAQKASLVDSQNAAIEKWKMLAHLYPDFFLASGSYAYFSWQFANRYGLEEITAAQHGASPRNPRANTSELLLTLLYLGNERYSDALHHFSAMGSDQDVRLVAGYARVYAAQRQFAKAEAKLAEGKSSEGLLSETNGWLTEITFTLDQGNWTKVWAQLNAVKSKISDTDAQNKRLLLNIEFSLRSLEQPGDSRNGENETNANILRKSLVNASGLERTQVQFALLFTAYLAAHRGDANLASNVLDTAGPEINSGNYPMLSKMLVIVRAEIARIQHKPKESIALLTSQVDGTELYLTHVVLMDAYATNQDFAAARSETQWQTIRRGRAYAEFNPQQMLLPYNVALSNLAWLSMAEYSLALGDKDGSRAELKTFQKFWPDAQQQKSLAARITALQTKL